MRACCVATTTGLATSLAIFVEGQETTREDSRGHSVEVRGGACLGERRLGLLGECLVETLDELSAQLLGSLVGEQQEDEAEQQGTGKRQAKREGGERSAPGSSHKGKSARQHRGRSFASNTHALWGGRSSYQTRAT